MNLGAFSVSLTVKDIKVSKVFYEKLGFEVFGGELDQNWVIMRNGSHVIGLFQGMFEKNILTFNPGWDQEAKNLDNFTDIRELEKEFLSKGINLIEGVDKSSDSGPASMVLEDPDGNTILLDQHR